MPDLPTLALQELTRRRSALAGLLDARKITRHVADALAGKWSGIAAWHGAVLPDDLRPYPGFQSWLDHAPAGMPAADWQRELAIEARRAWNAALAADPAGKDPRTRTLRELAAPLATAAGLPLIEAPAELEKAA